LFGLMLGAGMVALVYGFVWVFLLSTQGRALPAARPRPTSGWARWRRVLLTLPYFAPIAFIAASDLSVAASELLTLLVCAPALATVLIVGRRGTETGVFPRARSAPLGMFWVSMAVSIIAVVVAVASLTATITLGHSC